MSGGRDREDTFIQKLSSLEEDRQRRARGGLDELIPAEVAGLAEPSTEELESVAPDPVYIEAEGKLDADPQEFEAEASRGLSSDDPVRMYLREIGRIKLLTADQEIDYARKIEMGGAE